MLGLSEFLAALERAEKGAEAATKRSVVITAAEVEAEAKRNFEGSHKAGQPHIGGDKPNVVTGQTRRSITHDPVRRLGLVEYGTVVAPRVAWARRLELGWPHSDGTVGHGATRAFPYFSEPARKARDSFRAHAAEEWDRYLRRI